MGNMVNKTVVNIYIIQPFIRKEILSFATTWMNLEDIMLSGTNQKQKYKYCIISFICGV